jgi:hypothetical protein
MRTFFRDFASIEKAWGYASQQNALGHNVRVVTTTKHHRVYFSGVKCKLRSAVDVLDVPSR